MLYKAIEIANRAHAGQVDKAGELYILHPLRVMLTQVNELERICAVMHDVVEDSDITFDNLRKEGFSEEVISVLDCLTKRDRESYDDFIERILVNETACRVKLADLRDNMNLSRIKNPAGKDIERLKKYRAAADRISDVLPLEEGLKKERAVKINGCVSMPAYMNRDDFQDSFIGFIEMNGWSFGGGIEDVSNKQDE